MDLHKSFQSIRLNKKRWKIVDKMFLSLLITGAIIELSSVGSGFIDGLIVSRFLGAEAMAAEGIAHPIYSIIGVISGLISVGMQLQCSQLLGRGKVKDFSRFFSICIYVGIALSVSISILVFLFSKPLAIFLGASGNGSELLPAASSYLTGISFGIPALILVSIMGPALQLDSGRKLIRTGAIIESVADIILDILAVYFGFGILGVGIATSIAAYLDLFFLISHFAKKDRMLHLVKPQIPIKDFLKMVSGGTEKATRRLTNIIRPVILNSIILSYGGAMAMSSLSVRNNFSNFAEIFATGLASAVSLLTGMFYAESNEEAIKEIKHCEWHYTVTISGILCVLLLLLSRPIAGIYFVGESEAKELTVFALRMLALQGPLQAIIKSRVVYLQAICKKINMTVLIFASQLVFIIFSALVLGSLFGTYGILACFTCSDLLSLLAVYIFYQIKTKKIKLTEKDLLGLPDSFYPHPGDLISLEIRDMEDVELTSQQIMLFCKGHHCPAKTAYHASLVCEELCSNIIRYGFPKMKVKDPIIDIRLVYFSDRLIMRIRDDCPSFDITKLICKVTNEDADMSSHFGIRILANTAKDIRYTHAFETNNLIVTFTLPDQASL